MQLRIEPWGVLATSVYPAHTVLRFDFKNNGKSKRSNTAARLVAQLVAFDFPELAKSENYRFRSYRVWRVNGKVEWGYRYTMRLCYRHELLSARSHAQLRIM